MRRPVVMLFDLGGVLVESSLLERLHAYLPALLTIDELKSKWLESSIVRSFEKGACTPTVFASTLVNEWRLSLTPRSSSRNSPLGPRVSTPAQLHFWPAFEAGTRSRV